MPRAAPPHPDRRARLRVQQIRSPLTRVAYVVPPGTACLLLLDAGQARLRRADEESAPPGGQVVDGPRVPWRAEGAGITLTFESGARGRLLLIPSVALIGSLSLGPLGEQIRRTLGQDMSFAPDPDARIIPLIAGLEAERMGAEAGVEVAEWHYLF
ncbi:hypothetical protein [Paracoccus sp. S1E-3]|uniref:hypothetical protein n=1 Tax=Paracoccus sp. S1E-3 TaxID=2756130 RepID=UPI0015EEC4EB|nr:hypothetical protein [Paracoccus sp. S1E-3]MBA4490305.1 hypothetical protein [Paracoccus sp. S1E-3]